MHRWVHFVLVFQYIATGFPANSSTYLLYQNGIQVASLANTYYPQAVVRSNANLGLSNWPGDQQWSGLLDTFNVYNTALTAGQITTAFTNAMGSSTPTYICDTPYSSSAIQAGATFFNATFDSDPRTLAGGAGAADYYWLASDSNDTSALQLVHRGLVAFNIVTGMYAQNASQFIDLRQTSGPNAAVSTPIGAQLGGLGTGSIGDGTMVWTFETMYKPFQAETAAKIFDLSDNNGSTTGDWEIIHGYNGPNTYPVFNVFGNTAGNVGTTQYKLNQASPSYTYGQWYHFVLVAQYNASGAYITNYPQATYLSYVNGALQTAYTPFIAGIVPPFITRQFAYLGRSSYGDPSWTGIIDFFRVYSVALTANQAAQLYTSATGSPVVAPSTGGTVAAQSSTGGVAVVVSASSSSVSAGASIPTSSSSGPSNPSMRSSSGSTPLISSSSGSNGGGATAGGTTSSSSSSLSGGAIAGIVIGSVVGAGVILVVCFLLFCGRGGGFRGKAVGKDEGRGAGGFSNVDQGHGVEMSQAAPDNREGETGADGETGAYEN